MKPLYMILDLARDRRGTAAVIFALIASGLLGFVGLAIDYSRATSTSSKLQLALDSAVLAGARATADVRDKIATAVFHQNFRDAGVKGLQVQFQTQEQGRYTAVGTLVLPVPFMSMFDIPTLDIARQSTAQTVGGAKVCILVLDATATQAFLVNGGAKVLAPDCEIHVHSKSSPAAIFNGGTSIDTARICIAGNDIIDNGGYHPKLYTACQASADPYAGKFPAPNTSVCTYSNLNIDGGSVTLKPGVYCGWINFNNKPTVQFEPGVYVIKDGGWNVNGGSWTGNGVTFYFADQSKIQFNSAVAAKLSAPTSGTYENVVIFEKPGLGRSQFVLDDSRSFNITGLIYLPSRDTTFNAASNVESKNFSLVVNTLILNQTNWTLDDEATEISGGTGSQIARLVD